MKKIVLLLNILLVHASYAQVNFGIKQELEKGSGFGYRIAVSDDYILAGKNYTDRVKVYAKQADGTWLETQTLTPSDKPDTTTIDWGFGSCIAVNDSFAIITAVYKSLLKPNDGGLYFYKKQKNGLWVEEAIVENPTGFRYYGGKNITIYKNKATVSHNNGYPGFVHIYERSSDGIWSIQDTILRATNTFGGIDSQKAYFQDSVFTAMFFNFDNQVVKEFRLQKDGTWKDSQTIYPDTTGVDTYFGQNLTVYNNEQMAVGSYYAYVDGIDTSYKSAGKVYMYERINGEWELKQKLTAPIPQAYAYFGRDVVFKGSDTLIVAAHGQKDGAGMLLGALFFYVKENGSWNYKQKFYNKEGSGVGVNINRSGEQIISFGYSSIFVLENLKDCNGVVGGTAQENSCDICYGGTTGLDSLASEALCIVNSTSDKKNYNLTSITPNPFSSELNIALSSPDHTAQLYDCYGKLIDSNIRNGVYSTSYLKPGVYIIAIHQGDHKVKYRLVKY